MFLSIDSFSTVSSLQQHERKFTRKWSNFAHSYFESYNDTQQDEIQSTYFGNLIFSIFTDCGYILNNGRELFKRSVAVVG